MTLTPEREPAPPRAVFSRTASIADCIQGLLKGETRSLDAALYRLNHPQLAAAVQKLAERGSRIRLIVDRGKHNSDEVTRRLLDASSIPYRLLGGRRPESKMHHKFAILNRRIVLTGSYNWTSESQDGNFENLLIVHDSALASEYQREFEALWEQAQTRS